MKRSIVIAGHKTSVSLEDQFWTSLKEIATENGQTASECVHAIDINRKEGNLSSAIRLYVLEHYRAQQTANPGVPVTLPAPLLLQRRGG